MENAADPMRANARRLERWPRRARRPGGGCDVTASTRPRGPAPGALVIAGVDRAGRPEQTFDTRLAATMLRRPRTSSPPGRATSWRVPGDGAIGAELDNRGGRRGRRAGASCVLGHCSDELACARLTRARRLGRGRDASTVSRDCRSATNGMVVETHQPGCRPADAAAQPNSANTDDTARDDHHEHPWIAHRAAGIDPLDMAGSRRGELSSVAVLVGQA